MKSDSLVTFLLLGGAAFLVYQWWVSTQTVSSTLSPSQSTAATTAENTAIAANTAAVTAGLTPTIAPSAPTVSSGVSGMGSYLTATGQW